ncbi:hypothetical protein C1Y18_04365 [Pseudomonas sp. MPR-R5A]|nr:hypothetical protein C1Y18_04365 [Pseudomonas sp. MPR-R5A]
MVTFGWAGIPGSFPKVTRCKSGTLSRRYRSNGYVPIPPTSWSAQRPPSGASRIVTPPLPHLI